MRVIKLYSIAILSNLARYIAASTFLGVAIALFSIPRIGVQVVSEVVKYGGIIPLLFNTLSQTMATPLVFLIVVLPSMVTELLSNMRRGSALISSLTYE